MEKMLIGDAWRLDLDLCLIAQGYKYQLEAMLIKENYNYFAIVEYERQLNQLLKQ